MALSDIDLKVNPKSPHLKDVSFDWPAYLKEGLPDYDPLDTDSEHSQLSEDEDDSVSVELHGSDTEDGVTSKVMHVTYSPEPVNGTHKGEVVSVQCKKCLLWYKEGFEAEQVLSREVHNVGCPISEMESKILIKNDIKEYHIIREILWGLSSPPRKMRFFNVKDGLIKPHPQLCIEGVSTNSLQSFLSKMCRYMNMVLVLETFSNSLKDYSEISLPKTLLAYNATLSEFLRTFKKKIEEIELRVKQQDGIETLHQIYVELTPWLDQLEFVVEVHLKATEHWDTLSNWYIAMKLLTMWFDATLDISVRQHVTTAARIFLNTFQPFFCIIDEWLKCGELIDTCGEFFIYVDNIVPLSEVWSTKFVVHDFQALNDHTLLNVLQQNIIPVLLTAGKSACILKELDVKEVTVLTESDDWPVDKDIFLQLLLVLETALSHFEVDDGPGDDLCLPLEVDHSFDDVHDTSLPLTVDKYVYSEHSEYHSVYKRIAEHTNRMFVPFEEIFAKKLLMLLKPRADLFGIMLNHVIIDKYQFYSKFSMMKTLFFMNHPDFFDIYTSFLHNPLQLQFNQIFPTLQLHVEEAMESMFPGCGHGWYSIVINHEAFDNKYNIIPFLQSISFNLQMEWPLSLIIQPHYQHLFNDIFHFLLPLKWAFYTATHLNFNSINSVGVERGLAGLFALRFWILTALNAIATFFVCHVMRCYGQKIVDAMNHATDFNMLITAYSDYMLEVKNLFRYLGADGKLRVQINNLIELVYELNKLWIPALFTMEEKAVDKLKLQSSRIHVEMCAALDDILLQEPTGSDSFVHYEALHLVFQQNNLPQY